MLACTDRLRRDRSAVIMRHHPVRIAHCLVEAGVAKLCEPSPSDYQCTKNDTMTRVPAETSTLIVPPSCITKPSINLLPIPVRRSCE